MDGAGPLRRCLRWNHSAAECGSIFDRELSDSKLKHFYRAELRRTLSTPSPEQNMKVTTLLTVSLSIELATGVALIVAPSIVVYLLLNAGLVGGGVALGRICGIGLFSLAIACRPLNQGNNTQAVRALFLYNLLAAFFLGYLRVEKELVGFLLLPAGLLHALMALLFAWPAYQTLGERGSKAS